MGLMNSLKGLFGGGDEDAAGASESDASSGEEAADAGDGAADASRAAGAAEESSATGSSDAGTAEADAAAAAESDAGEPGGVGEEGTPPTEGAEMLVEQASENGYDLDFSPQSIETLDELVADFPDENVEQAAAHLGAYLGEVFVRTYDGMWTLHDEAGWVVELPVGDAEGGGTETLAVPTVVGAVVEGEATFSAAYDAMLEKIDDYGPDLSDEPYPEDEPGPTLDLPATQAASEDVVEYYKDAAAKLVAAWPEKRLNYTPESLERLDDLLEDVYDLEAGEAAESDAIVPEDVDLGVPDGIELQAFAGYVGEVFVRNYDAEWRQQDDQRPVIVVEGSQATAEINPVRLVAAIFGGDLSFGEVHEHVVTEAGIETED